MVYLTNLDLSRNELQNAVLQPLAAAPANPRYGQIYTDSTTGKIMQWLGASWETIGAVTEESDTNGNIKVDGAEIVVYELPVAGDALGGVKNGGSVKIEDDGTANLDITHYEGIRADGETDNAVFTRVLDGATPNEGDVFIIKTLIAGEKYSYAAFVYDEGAWNAMDGNVDATNVILRSDITTAGSYTQVGNITKAQNGTGSISAAGKSVADVFTAIFTKELNPTKNPPSVTLTFGQAGAKEVGTSVTPSYSAILNAGSYTYGPETGIKATSWEIGDTDGHTATAASGSFAAFTVGDNTSYKITAKANYTEGAIPVTNLGNAYPSEKIAAGSASKTSGAVTGYRSYFYGSKETAIELNSANIRKLTNSGKAVGNSQTFSLPVVEGATQVIVAFPTNINKTLSKVLDVGAFGTDIVGSFTKSTVNVEGANNYEAVSYDVWVYAPDAALGANTYTVTIA